MRVSHKQPFTPEVKYVDRVSEVKVVEYVQPEKIDLTPVHARISKHEEYLQYLNERINSMEPIYTELEMQRRALVALKTQRDVDRSRRLMFMNRMKKQFNKVRNENWKLKLAAGASIVLSILTFIIK